MTKETNGDIVHIDFKPQALGNPQYDNLTGIEAPHKQTGCITAGEAAAAARGWDTRRQREWADIIESETEQRDYPTEADMRQMRLNNIEQRAQTCIADLRRLSRILTSLDEPDTEALMSNLNHLHMQAGSVLRDIEALAGREWVEPHCEYGTLRLVRLGGYSTDPRTGQRMCPFSDYREPVKSGSGN